jgi:hypothetical protein
MTKENTIEYLIELAKESLGEYDMEINDISDVIHEIADSCVPVYTIDILEVGSNDHRLMLDIPEIGPAFDGMPTPVNIIAANIFERIVSAMWEYWDEIKYDVESK